MSNLFREYVRKIGSGPHTGKPLTRAEAAEAARLMLCQQATPAQIGAFLIAHRIRRPTGEELAGMLDTYSELGPQLAAIDAAHPVTVLSAPYDGRDRTAPLSLLTSLVLAAADYPVLQHGSDRTPTKEGVTLIEGWQSLGVDWTGLTLAQVQQLLQHVGLGFVYLPEHFPQAHGLVTYRREIGKRPPLATLELIWCPYAGAAQLVAGFVHPPTEQIIRQALELRGTPDYTTVKGLEGSCDLPRERTAIIGLSHARGFKRLHLHPGEFSYAGLSFAASNVPLEPTATLGSLMLATLQPKVHSSDRKTDAPSQLRLSLLWNSGFYLWRCGATADLKTAIALAADLLDSGRVWAKLLQLQAAIANLQVRPVVQT